MVCNLAQSTFAIIIIPVSTEIFLEVHETDTTTIPLHSIYYQKLKYASHRWESSADMQISAFFQCGGSWFVKKKEKKINKSTLLSRFNHHKAIICRQVPWKSIWNLYCFTNVVEIYAFSVPRTRCVHNTFPHFWRMPTLIYDQ
jgi:hypothetical protein